MSYDIIYTIRENVKKSYYVDLLFWGRKRVYDYKSIQDGLIFDCYDDALLYMRNNCLTSDKYHVRRTISHSGGVFHRDYIYRRYLKYGKAK